MYACICAHTLLSRCNVTILALAMCFVCTDTYAHMVTRVNLSHARVSHTCMWSRESICQMYVCHMRACGHESQPDNPIHT